jgi:hypothetical protein
MVTANIDVPVVLVRDGRLDNVPSSPTEFYEPSTTDYLSVEGNLVKQVIS